MIKNYKDFCFLPGIAPYSVPLKTRRLLRSQIKLCRKRKSSGGGQASRILKIRQSKQKILKYCYFKLPPAGRWARFAISGLHSTADERRGHG